MLAYIRRKLALVICPDLAYEIGRMEEELEDRLELIRHLGDAVTELHRQLAYYDDVPF